MNRKQFLFELSKSDSLAHAARLFGRQFSSRGELLEFASTLETPEKVVSKLVDESRLLFDTEWNDPLEKQIESAMSEHGHLVGTKRPGIFVATQCIGRMMQANDLLLKSREIVGTPLIDAPTSWKYFSWKLENDVEPEKNMSPLHIVQGLQEAASGEMEWLGAIPPQALIEIRQAGAEAEIRELLSRGIDEIVSKSPNDFEATSSRVVKNLTEGFEQHRKNINELRKSKMKFYGYDIGSWIVTGALEVAAAVTGNPLLAVAGLGVNQFVDAPKLKDIPQKLKALKQEGRDVRSSAVGLFFQHAK